MATATKTALTPDEAERRSRRRRRVRFEAWAGCQTHRTLSDVATRIRELTATVRAVRAGAAFRRDAGVFLGRGRAAEWGEELAAAALTLEYAVCLIDSYGVDG